MVQAVPTAEELDLLLQAAKEQQQQPGAMPCNPQDIAMLVWGCSKLAPAAGLKLQPSWVGHILSSSYMLLPAATAKDLVCILTGLARLRVSPGRQYMEAACAAFQHVLGTLNPQEQANGLSAVAIMGHKPSGSFMTRYCSCSMNMLTRYSPQGLCLTIGAMARLGYKPNKAWCRAYLAASLQLLPQYSATDYSRQIYFLAALDLKPGREWMDRFLVALRPHLTELRAHDLTSIIWALGRLDHRPGVDWMQRFFDQVNFLTGRGGVEALPQLSVGFGTVILHGVTMWAAQRLDYSLESGVCHSSCSQLERGREGGEMGAVGSSSTSSSGNGGSAHGMGGRDGYGKVDGGLGSAAAGGALQVRDGTALTAAAVAEAGGEAVGSGECSKASYGLLTAVQGRSGGLRLELGATVGVPRGLPQLSLALPAP